MDDGRIRSVWPGLFTDDAWAALTVEARLFGIGILTQCDDEGVFVWSPRQLRRRILPDDNVSPDALLDELQQANIIHPFTHEGDAFGAVRNFRVYQRPRRTFERGILPTNLQDYVFGGDRSIKPTKRSLNSTKRSLNRVVVRSGEEGRGGEGKGEESVQTHTQTTPAGAKETTPDTTRRKVSGKLSDEAFEKIKSAYPRRIGSNPWRNARSCMNARIAEGTQPLELLEGTQRYAAWTRAEGKFGTKHVMQAQRFFGPNREFADAWRSSEDAASGANPDQGQARMREIHFAGLSPTEFYALPADEQARIEAGKDEREAAILARESDSGSD